ncbi:MAG TPA: hypothetical protein V6D06_15600 [Trichocoleus sp.]
MTTERLHMAIKNFDNMNQMVERYTRLCRAYVKLSERFHQLDVEHMKLKGNMVPLIKAVKAYKQKIIALERQNLELQQAISTTESRSRIEVQNLVSIYEEQLESLRSQLEELKALEWFTSEEAQIELAEAEHQIELDEETFQEMAQDASPDLSAADKALLLEYHTNPAEFVRADPLPAPVQGDLENGSGVTSSGASIEAPLWALEAEQN